MSYGYSVFVALLLASDSLNAKVRRIGTRAEFLTHLRYLTLIAAEADPPHHATYDLRQLDLGKQRFIKAITLKVEN